MALRATIAQGARAPTALRIRIVSDDPSFDASTVTSAVVTVTRIEDGSTATWTFLPGAGPLPTSPALAYALYTLAADGSDVLGLGNYDGAVSYMVPGGEVEGESVHWQVQPGSSFRRW